jgi:hypothetical protein
MATRESQVVTHLRTDEPLGVLVPGGIYADADLGVEGITDAVTTPDVWTGGSFQPTIVVRERAAVPTGDLQSIASGRTSTSQAVEVWVYAQSADTIQSALDHVYRLLMGKRLARAFSATWAGGAPLMQAPELPAGIKTRHEDYRIVIIRTRVTV